ncbi:MAG TPA: prolyl oligopeptidase family serine peptidase [Nitrospiria bacterium]|nr:prolyl oligopeptidase family serine peptidase [Nitrospiria bacterium]
MFRRLTIPSFFALVITLTGCLYYGQYSTRSESPPVASIDPDYFHTDPSLAAPRLLSQRDRDGYTIQKLQFKHHVAFLYLPDHIQTAPVVIIHPITQGEYYTKQMAHFFAQEGFICLRFQSHGHLVLAKNSDDALTRFESLLRDDVIDVMEGIDWLDARTFVDRQRIGIVGVSMGAIISSVVAGADPRIQAGVFILGGGDLAGILFSSTEPTVVSLRDRIEEEEDLTPEELLAEVGHRLRNVDPLTYASRLDPNRILMINAYFDHVIRRRYAMALWKAAGEPSMVMLPTGHYSAGLFFDYAQRLALAHFQKVFGLRKKE